jgi:N-acetyl-anhydromuramyl-L-alanine amidase AmpD
MDLTPLIKAIIMFCLALLTGYAIPWLKNRASTTDLEILLTWTDVAVRAAEQLYTSDQSAKKKLYVQEFLKEQGYDVDTDEIDSAIEAAVLSLHNALKEVEE